MSRALLAELSKLKGTLALWVSLLCPLVVVLLAFAIAMRIEQPLEVPRSAWGMIAGNGHSIWALLMLPLFVALVTTLTGQLEWAGSQWKHLFAQPVARWHLYAAKLFSNLLLSLLATAALVGWTLLAGISLWVLKGSLGVELGWPPVDLLVMPFLVLLAGWHLVALHTWISLRFESVVACLGVGVAGSVGTVIITSSRYIDEYPWSFPIHAYGALRSALFGVESPFRGGTEEIWSRLAIFSMLAVMLAIAGGWNVCRREVR